MEVTQGSIAADSAANDGEPKDARQAVRAALDRGESQRAIAREVGISSTALSQWLNGRYLGDNEAVAAKVHAWHSNRLQAADMPAQCGPRWVETPSARTIESALKFAQFEGSISVIYGGAGVGKTTAIRHYAATRPNVWVVTATPSCAGLMATLEAVAGALDLRDLPNRPSAYSREIVKRLIDTRGLVVVDEAQHLAVQALEELRSIHDASGVGMTFAGNHEVYARLTGGSRKATFAQLFSRIGHKRAVQAASREDTRAILDSWGIAAADAREWCERVASLPGGLRGLTQMLRAATIASQGDGRAIDLPCLKAAWHSVGGEA